MGGGTRQDGSWGVRGPSQILGAELPMGLFMLSITRDKGMEDKDLGESYKMSCSTRNVTAFPLLPLSALKWGHVNPGDAHAMFLRSAMWILGIHNDMH